MVESSVKETKNPAQLSYQDFSKRADDTLASRALKKELTASHIAQNELSAEEVSNMLKNDYVVVLRRSLIGDLPLIALFIISLPLFVILTNLFTFTIVSFHVGRLFENEVIVNFPLLVLLPVCLLGRLLYGLYNRKYVISETSVTIIIGVLDIHVRRIQLHYNQLKEMEVEKNLYQRCVNVGDIRVSTAMFDEPEITLEGIHNPYYFTSLIRLIAVEFEKRSRSGQEDNEETATDTV